MTLIGIDFSLNKTAACILYQNVYYFFCWPLEIDDKSIEKLKNSNINVYNRNRIEAGNDSSSKIRVHITMANNLCNSIIENIKPYITNKDVIIAFEGAAFSARGNIAQELTGYRYILTNELGKLYGLENIFTYAPMSVKSTAGCASKENKGKDSMIEAFKRENINNEFHNILKNSPQNLKKKTNYVSCIDDLVDSYFVLKTLQIKQNL